MTDEQRRMPVEPRMAVFIGLVLAKLVIGARDKEIIDFVIAGNFVVGGFGPSHALPRRWWVIGLGLLAVALVWDVAWMKAQPH